MRGPTRQPARAVKRTARQRPTLQPDSINPQQIAIMADQTLDGGVVQPSSIPELCALLDVLRSRGYELKRRTEWEQYAAPWLLIVVPSQASLPREGEAFSTFPH